MTDERREWYWSDVKTLLRAKTAVIALITFLVGTCLILLGGFVFTDEWQTIISAIGVTLLTSSVLGVVTEAMLRLDTLEPVLEEVRSLAEKTLDAPRAADLVASRREINFAELLGAAQGELLVVGISSNDILAPGMSDLIKNQVAQSRLLRIRIALLDPESLAATARAKAKAYRNAQEAVAKIQASLIEAQSIGDSFSQDRAQSSFTLTLLSEQPSTSLVVTSEVALVTPVLRTLTGGRSPSILVGSGGASRDVYEVFRNHALSYFETPAS